MKPRYFYDCEFHEDGDTIDLISIGIVCSDGREYYAVNRGADWGRIMRNDWLVANVVCHLPLLESGSVVSVLSDGPLDVRQPEVMWKSDIAREVLAFLLEDGCGTDRKARELWAWYGDYDHVALCQLWGRMIDLPDGVPMFTLDIKQEAERLGNPALPEQVGDEHNALADAHCNKLRLEFLEGIEAAQLARASERIACCPMDVETSVEVLEQLRILRRG